MGKRKVLGDRDSIFVKGKVVGGLTMSQRKTTHPSVRGQLQPYLVGFKKKYVQKLGQRE